MELATIAQHYQQRFSARYGDTATTEEWSALNAIIGCRTEHYGEVALSCNACHWQSTQFQSCGHRSCNRCQNHCTSQWLERQKCKLLPVEYFMVTFTLPAELRVLAKAWPRLLYGVLFTAAVETLKTFGLNKKGLAAELAMTGVLHTHTRRLDYHPHVHMIVPGGGVNSQRNEWRKLKGKYLFNGLQLATVFRKKCRDAIQRAGLACPATPKCWVVQCTWVGSGLPALKYLSRYLYRGVISDRNIVEDDGDYVTFEYEEGKTGKIKRRRLRGEDFLALVLQHSLPKGFRRARDYGFLHGNAKALLKRVQWLLQVALPAVSVVLRPSFICQQCQKPLSIVGFIPPRRQSG